MTFANVHGTQPVNAIINPVAVVGRVVPDRYALPRSGDAFEGTAILLGVDERGRPHASRFDGADRQTLQAAAAAMSFVTLPVTSEAMAELAAKLPAGKLFASGKAFVPFVSQPLFDRLVAYLPISARPVKPTPAKKANAAAVNEKPAGSNDGGAAPGNAYAAIKDGSAKPRSGQFPDGWDKIKVGHIVLATDDRDEGWWTAHVREDKGDGVYVLEWEEWADFDLFIRRREQIALLHPNYDGK